MKRVPNVGIRLASMILDHVFMCLIIVIPMIPFVSQQVNNEGRPAELNPGFQFLFLGPMILYFLKDSFGGKSIAKRILKLQVVNNKTGAQATVLQCFIRNIFIIIWPVEVIFTFFQPQRRLGDLAAGTRVAYYEPRVVVEDESILGGLV